MPIQKISNKDNKTKVLCDEMQMFEGHKKPAG